MAAKSTLLLLFVALLNAATHAFVAPTTTSSLSTTISVNPSSSLSPERSCLQRTQNYSIKTSSSQLAMSDKPEIEVISNPDKDFLEKKG